MNDTNTIISLSLRNQEAPRLRTASEQRFEEDDVFNLTFTGITLEDPEICTTQSGNTIATFQVDVKHHPHLPPTRLVVIAFGKQGVYAQQIIKRNSLVMVSGWFCVGQNRKGNEFVAVKAKHLRSLVASAGHLQGHSER
jgi:single-stranded DNA-binding protein